MVLPINLLQNLLYLSSQGDREEDDELEAKYGKRRKLDKTEQQNLQRDLASRANPVMVNPYASQAGLPPIPQHMMQQVQQPKQQQRRQSANPYETGFVGGGGYGDFAQATRHSAVDDPRANSIVDYFQNVDRSWKPGQPATRSEMDFLNDNYEEWEVIRAQLNKDYKRMDQPARAQVSELNRQADAVADARKEGRLSHVEFLRAMDTIGNQARSYMWDYHFLQPGSNPGDVVTTQDGLVQQVGKDGEREVIGFNQQWADAHTIQLPGGGMLYPIGPGKYKEFTKEQLHGDRSKQEGERKRLRDMFEENYQKALSLNQALLYEVDDISGQVVGMKSGKETAAVWEKINEQAIRMTRAMVKQENALFNELYESEGKVTKVEDVVDPAPDEMLQQGHALLDQNDAEIQEMDRQNTFMDIAESLMSSIREKTGAAEKPAEEKPAETQEEPAPAGVKIEGNAVDPSWRDNPEFVKKVQNPTAITGSLDEGKAKLQQVEDGTVVRFPNGDVYLKQGSKLFKVDVRTQKELERSRKNRELSKITEKASAAFRGYVPGGRKTKATKAKKPRRPTNVSIGAGFTMPG